MVCNRIDIDLPIQPSGNIQIIDAMGRLILEKAVLDIDDLAFDIQDFDSGIYSIKYLPSNDDNPYVGKFIKI